MFVRLVLIIAMVIPQLAKYILIELIYDVGRMEY